MSKETEFIKKIAPYAQEAYQKLGKIHPSVCIGMGAVESGWGRHAPGNNYFGLKCGSGKTARTYWNGSGTVRGTSEYYGTYTNIRDKFRNYTSMRQSVFNYYEMLNTSLYAGVKANVSYQTQMQQIKACGYMTSPTEVNSVLRIIKNYNLTQYDNVRGGSSAKGYVQTSQQDMTIIDKAVKWLVDTANDNTKLYSRARRTGPKYYDCSSFAYAGYAHAGLKKGSTQWPTSTTWYKYAQANGFHNVYGQVNVSTGKGLKKGDVLVRRGAHVTVYIGDGKEVAAHTDRYPAADQISVKPYRNHSPSYTEVWRYGNGDSSGYAYTSDADSRRAIDPTQRYYLCIGDSYAEGYSPDGRNKGWPTYFKEKMPLADDHFFWNAAGGAGLLAGSLNFLDLLNNSTDQSKIKFGKAVKDVSKITDVILLGGQNDAAYIARAYGKAKTSAEVNAHIALVKKKRDEFITRCKKKYPNALIWIGSPIEDNSAGSGGDSTTPMEAAMIETRLGYGSKKTLPPGVYVIDTYGWRIRGGFASDNLHPNEKGNQYIAEQLAKYIKEAWANVYEYGYGTGGIYIATWESLA